MYPRWSPDGQLILLTVEGRDHGTTVLSVATCEEFPLSEGLSLLGAWSPDSMGLACVTESDISGRRLYLVDAEGYKRPSMLPQRQQEEMFCWSPDATKIALVTGPDVVIIDRDGENMERRKKQKEQAGTG